MPITVYAYMHRSAKSRLCSAKAPAKDLIMDARAAIKKDACEVLAKIAKVQPSSADAPFMKSCPRNSLNLPLDFTWTRAGNTFRYPYLKPTTQLETLSHHGYFHRVLGVACSLGV